MYHIHGYSNRIDASLHKLAEFIIISFTGNVFISFKSLFGDAIKTSPVYLFER